MYDIHSDIGILLIRSDGLEWAAADILDSAAEVISDERMEADLDWVYDLRSVRRTVIGIEDMERILDRFSAYRAEGRVDRDSASVIVSKREDELHFTPTLYKYHADRPEDLFEVVETMEAARQYLDIQTADWDAALET